MTELTYKGFLAELLPRLAPADTVVASIGLPGSVLFRAGHRPRNFYVKGAMGLAGSVALGLRLGLTEGRVVVLDGDGSLLMNLGFLAVLGAVRPPGFYHLVLKNDLYASSGGQPVPGGPNLDFSAVARGLGVPRALALTGGRTLSDVLDETFASAETTLAVFPLNQEGGSDLPWEPVKIKYRFWEALHGESS